MNKFLAATAIGTGLSAWLAPAAAAATTAPTAETPARTAVTVARVASGDIVRYLSLPGTVHPNRQATLYAKVAGYLKTISVEEGDGVRAGHSLARIESPELQAELVSEQAIVKVAQAEYQRLSRAQAQAPDLVVPMQVDDAKGRLDTAEARLQRTRSLLAYTQVIAPFDGVVTRRHVDPGAFIPAATANSGAASAGIVTLMDFDRVRIAVPVPEIEAARVRAGQPATISTDGQPGRQFTGTVSRHAYAIDDATRTLRVEIDLPNPERALRPGMYANVRLGVEQHLGALLIPVGALIMEKNNAFVYVVDGTKARRKAIKAGFNDGRQVEVVDGLAAGDNVILAAGTTVTDGADIEVATAR